MKGIVITHDGEISIRKFASPLYQTLGKVVGGYIEHVLPTRLPAPYCMIVNEDGHSLGLPVNPFGCYLYQTDIHGFPILGNIVIMQDGFCDGEADIVGIPDDEAQSMASRFAQKYNLKMKEDN